MACKVPDEDRESHDLKWSCEKHSEPVRFFCEFHKVVLCGSCVFNIHEFIPCQLRDIGDVIIDLEDELEEKLIGIEQNLGGSVKKSVFSSVSKWPSMGKNIDIFCNERLGRETEKERYEVHQINEKAEEEIQNIMTKKESQLMNCHADAEMRRTIIRDFRIKMLNNVKTIDSQISTKCNIRYGDRYKSHYKETDQNDKVSNIIVETEHKMKNLLEKWEEADKILLPSMMGNPMVAGLVDDHELIITNLDNNDTFVMDIERRESKKVALGNALTQINSCTSVTSKYIVCGMWKGSCPGQKLEACIRLYDRQWNLIKDITIPRNTTKSSTRVCVDVDRDGKIMAAETDQSNLYVINPDNGKITNTFRLGKAVQNRVQSLPTGELVAATGEKEITIFSRSGSVKTTYVDDLWTLIACRVDSMTGSLYVIDMDSDEEGCIYKVYELAYSERIFGKEIVRYPSTQRRRPFGFSPAYGRCGRLVCCDGNLIHVYKKTFVM